MEHLAGVLNQKTVKKNVSKDANVPTDKNGMKNLNHVSQRVNVNAISKVKLMVLEQREWINVIHANV